MDRSHRLVDIKKKLGLDRNEAYTVFKFPLKSKPSVVVTTPSGSSPKRMSANFPISVGKKPVPSPKPRRIPPKPPPYNSKQSANPVPTSGTENQPKIKPPILPKPCSPLSSPKSSYPLLSPSNSSSFPSTTTVHLHASSDPLPPAAQPPSSSDVHDQLQGIASRPRLSTPEFEEQNSESGKISHPSISMDTDDQGIVVVTTDHRPPSPSAKPTSNSDAHDQLQRIDSRPRLDTPKLVKHISESGKINHAQEPPRISMDIDDQGMAIVTTDYRPSSYIVLDVGQGEEEENNETECESKVFYGKEETTEQSSHPEAEYSEVSLKDPRQISEQNLPIIAGSLDPDTEYNVSSHPKGDVHKPCPPSGKEYSQLNRSGGSGSKQKYSRLPEYDEIDVSNGRPMIVTQTAGYSTLDTSSTHKERPPSAHPKGSLPSAPVKPPRPDVPPKPPVQHVTKTNRGSKDSSPLSSTSSPAHTPTPPPVLSPKHKLLSPEHRSLPPIPDTGGAKLLNVAESVKGDNLCMIDIDAMIARAKAEEMNIPGEQETTAMDTSSREESDNKKLFEESLVKLSDVIDDACSAKRPRRSLPHMYETLPWDNKSEEQPQPKPSRRKAPPPPPAGVAAGSPILPHKEKTEDFNKSLTLGRKPRHLIVTPTKSVEGDEDGENGGDKGGSPSLTHKAKKGTSGDSSNTTGFLAKLKRNTNKGSFKKRSDKKTKANKEAHIVTPPIATTAKSSTLPSTRSRGRSVDPFMVSGIYSTVEDTGFNRDERQNKSSSPPPEAVAYSVVNTSDVAMRNRTPSNRGTGLRKSQSVEHVYEFAKCSGNASSPLESARVKSSIASADDFNLDSHIYSTVNKTRGKHDAKGTKKTETPPPDQRSQEGDEEKVGRVSISPIREVSHVSLGEGQLYAVVTKQPKHTDKEINLGIEDTTSSSMVRNERLSSPSPPPLPPPLPPFRQVVKRQVPPKPAPYSTGSSQGESGNVVQTKAGTKFAHLLTSTPPSRPPPIPAETKKEDGISKELLTESGQVSLPKKLVFDPPVRIPRYHNYDEVDFDNPKFMLQNPSPPSPTPRPSNMQGKVRMLKPKERPAPPPPRVVLHTPSGSNVKSPKRTVHSESPGNHQYLSSSAEGPSSMFLFGQERINTFVEAGDGLTPLSPSTSDSTISAVDISYYDSDSTEWEASSDEEEDGETKTQPKVQKSKTYYIAEEILKTERTFVRGLSLLHKDFRAHMLAANSAHDKTVVTEETLQQILSNIGSLYQLNSQLLEELEDRISKWESEPKLGDIFVRRAPYLKLYSPYISNFDKALKTLEEQGKKNPVFGQVVREFELEPKCNNLTVAAYLLETVQRIPRYKLLIADYIKHLPQDSDDREDSEKAHEIISSAASHVNETIRQIENFRKIIEVSKKLIGDVGDSLISPHRRLLKEGELIKSSRKEKQPRMFFLFTDLLIYASAIPPANTTFRVIKRIPLDGMKVELLDDPEMKHAFQIISTCKSFRLEATTGEERDQWIKVFEGAIKDHVQKVQSRQMHRRSMMVEHTDDATDGGLGLFAPPWLPDSSVSMCQLCGIRFTVTRRRHHCRACGMIFCGDCSSYVVPLPYKDNKPCRVCQTCCSTLTEGNEVSGEYHQTKSNSLKRKPKRLSQKKISMPSVLREVRARDDSAHISGYLFYRREKTRQWKKKWFVVYNLVMYEFKRHEDVSAKQSIPLPSYIVTCPVPGLNDPLVFSLEHIGAGRTLFKADDEEQLQRWVDILNKAVKGETNILSTS